ncbi:uncharacterized protein MONOS_4937 [Monocercomonoides exilis]|uniref:uncharacterized protein n=1 Tax=Monocercomonoides exilis TaxID=2049356 RepID=UPI00355A65F1|nr:hypothetical protein MONOS_4937 [Monocercomonoides exilis]|eukprot:MONOS_4937.1-p1 / transcript=MONOS_4937.1 / gene=MONOS_4937 / organism=Monocercomonoides_exilis_PA203 / gene_product=unspecified product / transcript_product=unspecified product / location=Mono_scaffold00138:66015-66263(+) / protein_length=83 / sequence_SO=supercontig / SO=protein_coding / is_pseudo=false
MSTSMNPQGINIVSSSIAEWSGSSDADNVTDDKRPANSGKNEGREKLFEKEEEGRGKATDMHHEGERGEEKGKERERERDDW